MEQEIVIRKTKIIALVLLFWAAFVGVYMLLGGFLSGLFQPIKHIRGWSNWISGTSAAFLVTWVFLKWEGNSFRSIGLAWERNTILRFGKGILLGVCIFTLMVLVLTICSGGELQYVYQKADVWTLVAFLIYIPLGLMEEVAFRAYPFLRLNQVFGLRITQLIAAIAFAVYHMMMGWSIYVAFGGPFIWAFVFGLAAAWSRGIAMPAGIHISVNVLQSVVGLRGNNGLIWRIKFPESHLARTERVGLAIQLCLLVASVVMMEVFIRQRRKEVKGNA